MWRVAELDRSIDGSLSFEPVFDLLARFKAAPFSTVSGARYAGRLANGTDLERTLAGVIARQAPIAKTA